MLTPQLKNKIKVCLVERKWRKLADIFKPLIDESLLHLCDQESDLRSSGLGIKLILEKVNEGIKVWDLLIKQDDNPDGKNLEPILKAYADFNYAIKKLPGKNNSYGTYDTQEEDWIENKADDERWNRLHSLENYWAYNGKNLISWAYRNVEYSSLEDDVNIIKSDFKYYHKTIEIIDILEKNNDIITLHELLIKLDKTPPLKEAEDWLRNFIKPFPEIVVWRSRAKNAGTILTDLKACTRLNSWEGDCEALKLFEKTKDLEFFSEGQGIAQRLALIKTRIENVKQIESLISSTPLNFDLLENLSNRFPQGYLYPNSENAYILLQYYSKSLSLIKIINTSIPDEWEIVKLINEIKSSVIKLPINIQKRIELPIPIQERFELAQVRTSVLDILRTDISPRKTLTEREEIYFKNLEPVEDKFKNWELPEFKTHWHLFQNAKLKRKLLEDLVLILDTSDLKNAFKLFDDADKILATNAVWVKNRNKFDALKTEAATFEKLLASIRSSSNSNEFHLQMDAFRDLINFPVKYKDYKEELINLINDKLKKWPIEIDRFEKLSNSNFCWFVGWNWLHMDLINRVYISLQKGKYPLVPPSDSLVKETQPYEYNMHQSGTLIIPNTTNFLDCILTIWPGAEFFSYQNKIDWIKILGDPIYFKWDEKKKQWNQCKRP